MCVGLLNNLSYPIIIQSTHISVMIYDLQRRPPNIKVGESSLFTEHMS